MASIFTKIIEGEIPSTKIYEDDKCISILDINPNNKGHALVIPKEEFETIAECPEDLLGYLMSIAKKIAKKQMEALKCNGFNIIINNKPASGQEVPHLHIHVIPRFDNDENWFARGFPHQKYIGKEMQEYGEKLKLD